MPLTPTLADYITELELALAAHDRLAFVVYSPQADPGPHYPHLYRHHLALNWGLKADEAGPGLRAILAGDLASAEEYAVAITAVHDSIAEMERRLVDAYVDGFEQRKLAEGAPDENALAQCLGARRRYAAGLVAGSNLGDLFRLRRQTAWEQARADRLGRNITAALWPALAARLTEPATPAVTIAARQPAATLSVWRKALGRLAGWRRGPATQP